MKFLKCSLLLSTALFFSFQDSWAMKDVNIIEENNIVEIKLKNVIKNTQYKEKNWNSHTKDDVFFTIPYRPVKKFFETNNLDGLKENANSKFHAKEITDNSEIIENNEVLIIPGQDRRKSVRDTKKWPYRINGKLTIKFPFSSNSFGGSGVLVGPHHVLTVGHNVYCHEYKGKNIKNEEREATSINVTLGLHMKETPFDTQEVVKIYTFKEWIDNKNNAYDMALLILDKSIGYRTGWAGMTCLPDKILQKSKVVITGYPGDGKKKEKLKVMKKMSGKINLDGDHKFRYKIDTYGGQSGSGICIKQKEMPYIVGVHASGVDDDDNPENRINIGTRLTENKYKKIINLISKHYEIINSEEIVENNDLNTKKRKSIENDNSQINMLSQKKNSSTNQDNGRTERELAFQYRKEKNMEKSFEQFKISAEKGDTVGKCYLGKCYLFSDGTLENLEEGIKWIKEAVEVGNSEAQYQLGMQYLCGRGVEQNDEEGIKWLKLAAPNNKKAIKKLKEYGINNFD